MTPQYPMIAPVSIGEALQRVVSLINDNLFVASGAVLVVVIAMAGIKRMMSDELGNNIKDSNKMLLWGVIGFFVVNASAWIVRIAMAALGYNVTDINIPLTTI